MTTPTLDSINTLQTAEQKSDSCLVNLIKTTAFTVGVVVVCAIAWGTVAYFTNTIYFWGAIIVGLLVSAATMSGFRHVNIGIAILMLLPCLALTLLAVALGDFIYYTLVAAKELDFGLVSAVGKVAKVFIELEIGEGKASMVFGGIGALIGFFNAVRSD